jgi:hypothetical protein
LAYYEGLDSIESGSDESSKVNGGEELSVEFIVASSDLPKILELIEGSLNDIAPLVSRFVETTSPGMVKLVGDDGSGPELLDRLSGRLGPSVLNLKSAILCR